ncbi:hypothetical protein I6I99_10105 [Sphingobacterium multivorum]|nr:hypothetical protein [Sphingobacterium multivorum]QQT32887.1 hypothetical protein I6I99_10105 [Sphingobacterium multivorum]
MKPNPTLNAIHNSLWMRSAMAAGLMIIGLTLINATKIHRFTPLSYSVFLFPYLIYFLLLYLGYRTALGKQRHRWLGYGLIILAVLTVYTVVKFYFYGLVPQFMDGFSAPWLPAHKPVLISKIIGGLLFFVAIYLTDYLTWERYYTGLKFRQAEMQIKNISNVQLLSGHFLGNVYDLLQPRSKRIRSRSLVFFQYVSNKIANPTVLVPLAEEWAYTKILISYSSNRNFKIEGEELMDKKLLNRSVPTLTIMTWIENAVKYSADDPHEWIEVKWIKVSEGIQLQIHNRVAAADVKKGTGKGLELVNRLFESMENQLIELEYTVVYQEYFIVKLTFKNQ